jgi:hypothetical protein
VRAIQHEPYPMTNSVSSLDLQHDGDQVNEQLNHQPNDEITDTEFKAKKRHTKSSKPSPQVKKQMKTYKYKELIYHLDYECPRNKLYGCPLDCPLSTRKGAKKMTKKQVETHLKKECLKVEVQCRECS